MEYLPFMERRLLETVQPALETFHYLYRMRNSLRVEPLEVTLDRYGKLLRVIQHAELELEALRD